MMDYRNLLVKYIDHVGKCEGVTFLSRLDREGSFFSDEEWEELQKLNEEAQRR